MRYAEFVDQVRVRGRLTSQNDAERAIQATLETLGERLDPLQVRQLQAQLPAPLSDYLHGMPAGKRFNLNVFYQRVARREMTYLTDAIHHARTVMGLLSEILPANDIADVQSQLSDEFAPLFPPEEIWDVQAPI